MQIFGKFQLVERIGMGGMAEIFLAKPLDASLSKLVAVKRILPKFMDDPTFHEMFRREGAIVLRFRHHAIITVYEMGSIDGQYYMSMEYFPGKTLGNLMTALRDAKLKLEAADKILVIKSIAEALQYIHDFSDYGTATEIIHRDISPHNILIGFDGATKLIDFGIAKATNSDVTQSKTIKGKIPYMSPEQIRGDKLTIQTDIFSLGIVFWELLVGRKLFTGKTVDDLSVKIQDCKVPPISELAPDVPHEIARICHKALSKESEFRYLSAADMLADLDAYLRVNPIDRRQRRLAQIMQDVFPEDLKRLKDVLRQHEVSSEQTVVTPAVPVATPPSLPMSNPSISLVPKTPTAPKGGWSRPAPPVVVRRKTNRSLNVIFNLSVVVVLLGLGVNRFLSSKWIEEHATTPVVVAPKSPPLPTFAPPPLPAPVAVKPITVQRAKPVEALPPSPPPQPPPPPIAQPEPVKPVRPAAKVVERKVVAPPLPVPTKMVRKPARAKVKPPKVVARKPTPKVKPVVKSTPVAAPVVENEPTPSPSPAPAPVEATKAVEVAYITILADPGARILVNGSFVATEVLNEHKVPVDKPVIVTVVSASTGKTITKELFLKPMSRNIVEITAAEEERQPAGE